VASIVIDGYNVIGVLRGDLEAERGRFVEALAAYRRRTGHEVTVVFDGWKDGPGRESRSVVGGVSVVYSGLGERADRVVTRIAGDMRGECIVVSSDREVEREAWAAGAVPVGSDDFLRALERGEAREEDVFDDEDDEEKALSRKGRSRQLSKKQKAVARAVGKL
jgi:predicted RNA-binding protein with PIN domain